MPNNDDIFAPPSKEELAMFAPPSDDELKQAKGNNAISSMGGDSGAGVLQSLGVGDAAKLPSSEEWKAFGTGAASGATFGGAPKLGAAADLAQDIVEGKDDKKDLLQKWKDYAKARKDANKQLADKYPGATVTGELTGAALTAPLIPQLGGAKALGAIAKAAPELGTVLAGASDSALANIAGKGIAGAITGAPVGALAGAAGAEPGEELEGATSGAGMGALTGGALGSAAQSGSEALGAASDLSDKYDFLRKMKQSYKLGQEGTAFNTSEGKSNVAAQLRSIPDEVASNIRAADKYNGKMVERSLDPSINPNAAKTINIDPEIQQSTDDLWDTFQNNPDLLKVLDPKSRQLITKINDIGSGDLTALEAKALKDTLYDLSTKMGGLSSDVASIARQKSQEIGGALDEALKSQIPEYKDAATKFADFRSKIAEPLLQPGLPDSKRTKMLGDLKNKDAELYKGANNVLGRAMTPGESSLSARSGLNEVLDNLGDIEKSNPGAMQVMGGSADEVGQRWKDMSDKMAVLKQSQGFDPSEGPVKTLTGGLVGTGEGMTYGLANKAGQISNAVGQSAPVQTASKIFNSNDGQLMKLAQSLKGKPAIGWYGDALEKAIQDKNEFGRNAVLFKLMQIPEYRQMLSNPGDSQGNDNKAAGTFQNNP